MKNIVFFGGGTGLSTILKGIKDLADIQISAVVTVADSGGSTGMLRKEYGIPAIGDIRQVLIALARKESLLNELMSYRFDQKADCSTIGRHSLGNLIIYSLIDIKKDFYDGIFYLSKVFNVIGDILPVTDYANCHLKATYSDGSTQVGEDKIPIKNKKITSITYCDIDKITVNPKVIQAIHDADVYVFSCGSLYTSIIATLALPEIKKALLENSEKHFVYFSNIVTQPNETSNMNAYEHVQEIEKYLCSGILNTIIMNNKNPCDELISKYEASGAKLILPDERIMNSHCEVLQASLIDNSNTQTIRHDVKKIRKVFKQYLKEI